MARRIALLLVLVLALTACTSGAIQSGRTRDSSTADFDVTIEQANAPMTMPGQGSADVRFLITVKNRTPTPWTIERIALQSMGGGAYALPVRTREFDRVLAPNAEEQFEFWGTVDLADDPILTRAPITLRTKLYARGADGSREEEFMQRINGRVSVAVGNR